MKKDRRSRELAVIHIAKSQLCLDEDTYRAMLWSVARVKSSADLDYKGRRDVLDHLKACGFKKRSPSPSSPPLEGGGGGRGQSRKDSAFRYGRKPAVPAGRKAQMDKIEALLADAGRPWEYAAAVVRRMYGVDRLEWATSIQLRGVIAALVNDAQRRGKAPSPVSPPAGGGERKKTPRREGTEQKPPAGGGDKEEYTPSSLAADSPLRKGRKEEEPETGGAA